MTKRVFIIHGWGGSPECNWFPWLKKELEARGFEVHSLEMPNIDFPVINEWVSALKKEVGKPDKETYFIGHSIGCQTIMRYLQDINVKVGGVLFVAGFVNSNHDLLADLSTEEKKIIEPWLTTPIYFDKVKRSANKIVSIFSDDDPFVPLDDNKIFKDKLNSKIIILKHKGHILDFVCEPILEEFLKLAE